MVKIERFEDIEAWKKAREIAQQVYSVTCSGDFARDFGLRDQVQRAAVSIMANIVGGFDGGSNKEFIRILNNKEGVLCWKLLFMR